MKKRTKIKVKIARMARNIKEHPKTQQTIGLLKLKRHDKQKRIIIWSSSGGVILLLIIMLFISSTKFSSSSSKEAINTRISIQEQTIGQLNRIETQIKALKTQSPATGSNVSVAKITAIQKQLMQLSQSIGVLATQQDAQKTQAIVVSTGHDVTHHIDSVQNLLKQIKHQITPPHYLSVNALPFKVISVRGINGVLNAIIQSKGEYMPIVKNNSYGEWRLIQVSYDPQEVVFENIAKQMVKVRISR